MFLRQIKRKKIRFLIQEKKLRPQHPTVFDKQYFMLVLGLVRFSLIALIKVGKTDH